MSQDHVYVYDGVPEFVDSSGSGILLGAFCGFYSNQTVNVTATTGILTIYFDADISSECEWIIVQLDSILNFCCVGKFLYYLPSV